MVNEPIMRKSKKLIENDNQLVKAINHTIKRDFQKNYFKNKEQAYIYIFKITNAFKKLLESYKNRLLFHLRMNKKNLPDTIYNLMWYRSDVIKYTKKSFTTNDRNMRIQYASYSFIRDSKIKLQFCK